MESFSVSTVVEILSSPAPPNSSGTPPPIRPTSPPFFTRSAINPGFLFSSSFTTGKTSFITNSSAVCPINFWSSVRSAGVNTSPGCGDSRRKLPPFAAGLVRVAVAILVSPTWDSLLLRLTQKATCGAHSQPHHFTPFYSPPPPPQPPLYLLCFLT